MMVADEPTYRNALALNAMLHEYRLESVLGAGGFGITYLAWDTHLEKHVAIKEYLPGELAVRALDGSIVPVNTQSEFNYKWGLDRFIQEARTLARFRHPNIVRVNRFFETNGTSYMVMDYEAGDSLQQNLLRAPMPDEAALKKILLPILDGLQAVHQAGFLHRDIKPSNVFVREDGTPVLLDFGSARLATGAASQSLTSIVSPGYAPLEQYSGDGNQGPWSDIYALSGVLYRAVTGENPPDAVRRLKADSVPATLNAARTRYDERFLRAIEWGLKLEERLRPQNVVEWRELFTGRAPLSAFNRGAVDMSDAAVTQKAPPTIAVGQRAPRSGIVTPKRWKWVRRSAFLVAVAFALALFVKQRAMERELQKQAAQQDQPSPELQRQAMQRFEAADSDRSGDLNRDEMTKRLPRFAARFDEIDANHDGVVSLRELEDFLEKDGTAEVMKQADAQAVAVPAPPVAAPADRGIDTRMAPVPEQSGDSAGKVEEIPQSMKKEFIAADRNADGSLSADEVRGRFPAVEKNFGAVDTNHDGRISLDELWQFRKKMFGGRAPRP
ncbi:MAG: protein kinase [Betaproteobacteria bacterium]|nr:protein kinase [Betaproteobacteria bacterium]